MKNGARLAMRRYDLSEIMPNEGYNLLMLQCIAVFVCLNFEDRQLYKCYMKYRYYS